METPQVQGPAQAQVQRPALETKIHEEQKAVERLTNWVKNNPDNDPHKGTDLEAPAPEPKPETPAEVKAEEKPEAPESGETIEFDEETPFFELDYKGNKRKLSAKELREGWLAKEDYHRNIQKVKADEAEIPKRLQAEITKAQQQYVQQLEVQKQAVARLANVKPLATIREMATQDPAGAQAEFLRLIEVDQTIQQINREQQAAIQKLEEQGRLSQQQIIQKSWDTLTKDIDGWGKEKYEKLMESAVSEYGYERGEVANAVDARFFKVLHDADKYRQLQKAKPEISKKVVTVPKVVKPGSAETKNTSNAAQEASDRLKKSGKGEDFVAWYMAQQKQKRK